jgi:aminopeptidase N
VPLRVAAGRGAPQVQVLEGSGNAVLAGCAAPVLINAGQTGYFRTLYSGELAARQQAGFASLAPIDQLGLLRDAFALARADYQPLGRALALLEAVPQDANPLVTEFAAETWAAQYEALDEAREHERAALAALAQAALEPRLAGLGFDEVAGEQVVDANLRARLIDVLGRLGDERVAAEAHRRFALLAADPRALDGPLKTTWLAIATASADEAEWMLLARLAAESSSTAERQNYFAALGAAKDEALARRALEFALSGEAGTSSAAIIARVSVLHPELAFDFAADREQSVRALVDPSGWHDYLADLAANSRDPAMLARLEAIRSGLPAGEALSFTRVIDAMRVRSEAAPRQQQALLEWLAARG